MKSIFNKFYLASMVSTLGNWLTSIGLSLLIYDRFGAESLAMGGLFMTLPQFLVTKKNLGMLAQMDPRKVLVILNIICALNVMILTFNHELTTIYGYLFVAALLKTLHNTVSRSWLGDLAGAESAVIFKRLSGLTGLTLAVSPGLGALISSHYGFQVVFVADALSFVAAAGIYALLPTSQKSERVSACTFVFEKIDMRAWVVIFLWVIFVGIGTVHTAIDISYFKFIHVSETQIGYLLSAWGAGSFLAYLLKKDFLITKSLAVTAIIFGFGLGLVFTSKNTLTVGLCLLICGYFYSCIVGLVRQEIQSLTAKYSSLFIWGQVEILSSIISSILSVVAALIVGHLGLSAAIVFLTFLAGFFAIYSVVYKYRR